jgi:hypothetical protein
MEWVRKDTKLGLKRHNMVGEMVLERSLKTTGRLLANRQQSAGQLAAGRLLFVG